MKSIESDIRSLRKQKSLTLEQLAKKAHMAISHLSRIERGVDRPTLRTIDRLARALDVSPSNIVQQPQAVVEHEGVRTKSVPFFGYVPAGSPFDCMADLGSYPVPLDLWTSSRYALKIASGSMEPTLLINDIILVEYRENFLPEQVNGEICVVWYDGGNTVKRLKIDNIKDKENILLVSDNEEYKPIRVKEHGSLLVQGAVTDILRRHIWKSAT